jgi:8-oxo-dGTP pyrophosphatase MutT (NUDIX family)
MAMSDFVRRLREKVGHDLLFFPAAACLVRDGEGRILFVQHVEGHWTFPAGAVEPGEPPAEAAARECLEEAGVVVEPRSIVGVYGGPAFRFRYSNGDDVAWVTTLFEARIVSGEAKPSDDETQDARWLTESEAFALPLSTGTRFVLEKVLAGEAF